MKQHYLKKVIAIILVVTVLHQPVLSQSIHKNRVIILSDIENDPDDTQSFIRLLLYADVIDIRGMIATTSVHQKNNIYPQSIQKIVAAYGKVQPNLLKNEPGYPAANKLMMLIKKGQPGYGMSSVGAGKDSEGSDWIIKTLEEEDSRPLWICVWGGPNTLAQALFKLKNTKSAEEFNTLISKLRVYTISDQDDSGIWLRNTFPNLFYIVSPGGYSKATWSGMMAFVPGIDNTTISNKWIADNIQEHHGPMGALYWDVAYGMEGDTPSFLSLIPNGLSAPEHPNWGGWGGRYEYYKPKLSDLDVKGYTGGVDVEEETRPFWTNASDSLNPYVYNAYGRSVKKDSVSFEGNKVTLWRWRNDFQNDFAARMDWTTKPYNECNHPPVPKLGHADEITVKSGAPFILDASGTTDPDGDNLSYLWFQYTEAGTFKQPVKFTLAENLYITALIAPVVEKPETVHFILKVTDKGSPPLSRYKRVIVHFVP
ncbi:MAG TPA: nucleoside hydrolase-like domain-containing protein [Hanamia sp.]